MLQKSLIFFIFLIGPCLTNNSNPAMALASKADAKEGATLEDRIIGSVFKTAAKAFLLTADVEALKKSNIKKLSGMDAEKFRGKYAKIYPAIKEISFLKSRYGVAENMTRDEAIGKIKPLQKKEIYEMIDSIPDIIIAEQFRAYLYKKRQKISKNNMLEKISHVWGRVIRKIE